VAVESGVFYEFTFPGLAGDACNLLDNLLSDPVTRAAGEQIGLFVSGYNSIGLRCQRKIGRWSFASNCWWLVRCRFLPVTFDKARVCVNRKEI